MPGRCELIIHQRLWGGPVIPPKFSHSLAAGPPLMEMHKLRLHMRNAGPCLFTPECVSPSSSTHRNLISALETQIFLFNPLNPASTPWDPLCWATFWRICCRLNFDFCFLTGTHQKRESCSGSVEVSTPFSLDSFKEWRDFCLSSLLLTLKRSLGLQPRWASEISCFSALYLQKTITYSSTWCYLFFTSNHVDPWATLPGQILFHWF